MGEEIKALILKIEDLQGQLAGHRKARFGPKSESLQQLAFDLQEDKEIAAAASAQQDETARMKEPMATSGRNGSTVEHRCQIIWNDKPRCCRQGRPAPHAVEPCACLART